MGWQTDYRGEEERGRGQFGLNCWDWLFWVVFVFNSSQLQLTWHIVCAEIEFYWLIFENIIILPMTSPPEWGYGVKRGDKFSKKIEPSNLLWFHGREMTKGKKLETSVVDFMDKSYDLPCTEDVIPSSMYVGLSVQRKSVRSCETLLDSFLVTIFLLLGKLIFQALLKKLYQQKHFLMNTNE